MHPADWHFVYEVAGGVDSNAHPSNPWKRTEKTEVKREDPQ
jgi:hypothetical protein